MSTAWPPAPRPRAACTSCTLLRPPHSAHSARSKPLPSAPRQEELGIRKAASTSGNRADIIETKHAFIANITAYFLQMMEAYQAKKLVYEVRRAAALGTAQAGSVAKRGLQRLAVQHVGPT